MDGESNILYWTHFLISRNENKIADEKKSGYNIKEENKSFKSSDDDSNEQAYIEKQKLRDNRATDRSSVDSNMQVSADAIEQINAKIKIKKKQLGLMWSILFTILFIGFYEMIYSGIQKLSNITKCNHMLNNDLWDGILLLISRFIGLILWTIPVIYVYWAREFFISIRARTVSQTDEDDEDDEVDRYFAQSSDGTNQFAKPKPQTQSPLLIRLKESNNSKDEA